MGILRGRGSIKRKMKCREGEGALGEKWKPLGLQAECLGDKELMSSGSGEKLSSPGEWRRRSRGRSTARGLTETTIPLGSTINLFISSVCSQKILSTFCLTETWPSLNILSPVGFLLQAVACHYSIPSIKDQQSLYPFVFQYHFQAITPLFAAPLRLMLYVHATTNLMDTLVYYKLWHKIWNMPLHFKSSHHSRQPKCLYKQPISSLKASTPGIFTSTSLQPLSFIVTPAFCYHPEQV